MTGKHEEWVAAAHALAGSTPAATPNQGTEPSTPEPGDEPVGRVYLSAEEIAASAALAQAEQAALAAASLVPAHPAHLDPNSYTENAGKGYFSGLCAVCNNAVVLDSGTEPTGWPFGARAWALEPESPWLHVKREGDATPMGSLQPSPLTRFLLGDNSNAFDALLDETPYRDQVAAMARSLPVVPAAEPYPETKEWESLLRPEPANVVDLPQAAQENVFQIELARFVRAAPGAAPQIESKVVTVAEDSLVAARELALTTNEGWLLVESSVLSSDPVSMSPTANLPVVYTDEAALQPPVVAYDEPNIVSVSDDDTEHPREDPYTTTEGDI